METERPYAAHLRESDHAAQTVLDISNETAELAKIFAGAFHAGSFGEQLGRIHDLGKYTPGFQKRIWENGPKVDHTSAGAQELYRLYGQNPIGLLLAYCVAGHHAGLQDGGSRFDDSQTAPTLYGRLQKEVDRTYRKYLEPLALHPLKPEDFPLQIEGHHGFCLSFFVRMLFSCLVDADFLNTEAFMQAHTVQRGGGEGLPALQKKLDHFLQQKGWRVGCEGLNAKRSTILNTCINTGDTSAQGLYTLTVPTGGGKTVSSLAFALHHAVQNHMDRVIYVIPYCSIIEQTKDVFDGILDSQNVLAHYSGAQADDTAQEEMSPQRLAAENWEMPVIVTTAVQFFESLFSNRTSACRKLHSIANSVVIFDEAQTLPLSYLIPCVDAIAELVRNYHTTCVLCTATQPALADLFHAYDAKLPIRELCPGTQELYLAFRRVRYEQLGELTDEALARRLLECRQVLCIVSTKRQAKKVYALLDQQDCFHLSTLMTPEHRRAVLRTIRKRLNEGLPCRVVSTSLIEAGVDVDFPTVYRAYAGLDSEIQAGGRCNREGKRPLEESVVYLFEPESKYQTNHFMKRPREEAKRVAQGRTDIDAPDAVTAYFQRLYRDTGTALDEQRIVSRLEEGVRNRMSFPFRTIADQFHLIPDNTWTILVPRDEKSCALASRIQHDSESLKSRKTYREMGPYCVSVFEPQYRSLSGSLVPVDERLSVLIQPKLYDENTGLALEDIAGLEYFA